MLNPKSNLFLYLTPRQKSNLLGTIKSYVLNFPKYNTSDLINKFLEDEKYYLDIQNPHFEFMENYLDDDKFSGELKIFIDYLKYELEQKEKLKPYLDKQKELQKQMRKKAQEFKMSKLAPTKKQLYYYDKLIKNHNLKKKKLEGASRLDLKNWITEILDKYDK